MRVAPRYLDKCFAFAGARRVPLVLNATRMYNEGQERCRLGKRPLIITHIHMHIRVGTGVLNTRHGQRTREMEETTRCRRAYHPKLLIWHGPRVGLLAIDEECSFCEAVCCGVACPSTSTTSAVQSLRSRACSKCCALVMSMHRGRSAGCQDGRMRTIPSDGRVSRV